MLVLTADLACVTRLVHARRRWSPAKFDDAFVQFLFEQVEATRDFVDTSLNFALVVLVVRRVCAGIGPVACSRAYATAHRGVISFFPRCAPGWP